MSIESQSYHDTNLTRAPNNKLGKRPLMVGCSGGAGHISAILGIEQSLRLKDDDILMHFEPYTPVLAHQKPQKTSTKEQIYKGAQIMHAYGLGKPLQKFIELTPIPLLPKATELSEEVAALSHKEAVRGERNYIDILLDVYPEGYENAAIWNILQRNDKTDTLRKLIALQSINDTRNYQVVYDYFLNLLCDAEKTGKEYTEIISTQAMAIPALCDAVKDYNAIRNKQITLHQYLTDLPTEGAIHFFNVLSTLSPEQQQQIKLYAVNIEENILNHFFPNGYHFNAVYTIPASENPMVRAGFKNQTCDNSLKADEDLTLTFQKETTPWLIHANEQIASIMLGSQASNDTVEYVETLLKNGINKVFIFGGKNKIISNKIDEIIDKNPDYKEKIVRLDNQSDQEIAPLMTRSNIVIIRGGGLSVMEQMAMPHNPEQVVLLHHADSPDKAPLTSGIPWEDSNANELIRYLSKKNIYVAKTSPKLAAKRIAEAQIIHGIQQHQKTNTYEELVFQIQNLSSSTLNQCLLWLKNGEEDKLVRYFKSHIDQTYADEKKYLSIIEILNSRCDDCFIYIQQQILEEIKKNPQPFVFFIKDTPGAAQNEYDIPTIIDHVLQNKLDNSSSMLLAAAKNYVTLHQLQATISCTSVHLTPLEKLTAFKEAYSTPEVKNVIHSNYSNVFKRLIDEIIYQLARVFALKTVEAFFSPSMVLRKEMAELEHETYFENINGNNLN